MSTFVDQETIDLYQPSAGVLAAANLKNRAEQAQRAAEYERYAPRERAAVVSIISRLSG